MSWPDSRWETGLTAGTHLAVTRKRGPALSSAVAKGRGVRHWLLHQGHEVGRAGAGPEQGRERGKEGKQAAGGREVGRARDREGERKSFSFLFF